MRDGSIAHKVLKESTTYAFNYWRVKIEGSQLRRNTLFKKNYMARYLFFSFITTEFVS